MGKFRKIQALFWPVKVKLAKGNNRFDSETIEIKYQRMDAEEMQDLSRAHVMDDAMSEAERIEVGNRIIEDVKSRIVDWKIEDEDGTPLAFDQDNLDMVMGHPDYRAAIIRGFYDVQVGGAAKN